MVLVDEWGVGLEVYEDGDEFCVSSMIFGRVEGEMVDRVWLVVVFKVEGILIIVINYEFLLFCDFVFELWEVLVIGVEFFIWVMVDIYIVY